MKRGLPPYCYAKGARGYVYFVRGGVCQRMGRDNRAANLRSVSFADNCKNRPRNKSSTNPYPGVKPYRDRWQATIRSNRKDYHLGIFAEASDAIAARKAAEKVHGFHANHGRTAQENRK